MALLRYTLLRLLLFAVVGALCWIVGLRDFWLLLVAVFVSGLVSLVVLRKPRDEVSIGLDNRLSAIRGRLDRTAEEDAWVDAQDHRDQAGHHAPGRDEPGG